MSRSTPIERGLDSCVEDKSVARDSGNYARNLGRVAGEFVDWLADGGPAYEPDPVPDEYGGPEPQFEPITRWRELDSEHCAEYARVLRDRVRADELSGATANQYYNYVRAFLSWAVKNEYLDANPADTDRGTGPLPPDAPRSKRQQIWSPEQREAVLKHATERVDEAMADDARGWDVQLAARDRALLALLAYAGVRGAEVLRDPNDSRRTGVRWRDLTWPSETREDTAGSLAVLGKSGDQEDATVLEQAEPALDAHYRLQQPASHDWPLFPTFDRGTLYAHLRDEIGNDIDDIEAALREEGPFALAREHGVAPPAASTNTGRAVMRRLCEGADIEFDGDQDYLQPHGGRRGLGDEIYDEDPRLAQDVLRHESIETTQQAYRERKTQRDAGQASRIVGDDS